MGFFSKLFHHFTEDEYDSDLDESAFLDDAPITYDRSKLRVHNDFERTRYVQNCLDQIADASKEIDTLKKEYSAVTSYLTDMEEVEALPEDLQKKLKAAATHIDETTQIREQYLKKENRMSDEQFAHMEQMEQEVEDGIQKLEEAEHYQKLIRSDLRRLDNERHANAYQKKELVKSLGNYRGMTVISFVFMLVLLAVLLALQILLELEVRIPIILTIGFAAVAMVLCFVKYGDAVREIEQREIDESRLIGLQNTVKIRYVNNTQLLDYLYMKFQVDDLEELRDLWSRYADEKKDRERYEDATKDVAYYQGELLDVLNGTRVKDPEVWLHRTKAILDNREMVEVRHKLLVRRQSLRTQLDYNQKVAKQALEEVKDLAATYPEYNGEILQMVQKREDLEDI